MNIHIKHCKDCGKAYDYPECPYCRIKKKEEEDERKICEKI